MLLLLFVLLVDGVSGAETDISVMEGDSVTLHTDLTQILNDQTILWSFGPKRSVISHITRENNRTSVSFTDDEGFRGRLQVDQITGSLTIRNTRIRHSGPYELDISRGGTKPTSKIFHLTVQCVISGKDGGKSQSVSVMEGESVTLNPDESLIHRDDLMLWMFGDKDILLAKLDAENQNISLYDAEERFKDRLELNNQTGSLTIRNTRTTDSGLYQLQIRGRESLQQFILTVKRTGLSPGAVAWIVFALLAAAAAAGVAGVIYYRCKISELRKQMWSVSVTEGEDVFLKPNNKINKDDEIQWMFGEGEQLTVIAEISGKPRRIYTYDHAADEKFRGRLKPDQTTGSLTIRNTRTTHSGLYTLISSSGASQERFFVTVNERVEEKPVIYGGSVTLKPDPVIQRDDLMLWMFGDQDVIAQVKAGTGETYGGADERFRGRLELDETTGSLTIRNILLQHTGLYKLQTISSSGGILTKKFSVSMQTRTVTMTAGGSVHLNTDHPKIERDDEIQWMFGDENILIAEVRGGTGKQYDGPDERFRGRLELDETTGSLTITNILLQHTGHYNLKIHSIKGDTYRTYRVIRARGKSLLMEINASRIKPVNKSETVEIPLLGEKVPDAVNEQERRR